MLNHEFLEGEEMISQMGFFPFPLNFTSLPLYNNQTPLKTLSLPPQHLTSHLLSLQTSNANHWAWGEVSDDVIKKKKILGKKDEHLGVSRMKMKKVRSRKKVREPRFCFKTMSDVDVLDDGYKWRKYGQKVVNNTQHPRSYYRCTQTNCYVKKRVERLAEDPRMVITTYEGRHVHLPEQNEDNSQDQISKFYSFLWY